MAESFHIEKACVSGHFFGLGSENVFCVESLHQAATFMK